jgi:hypothetical protein
LQLRNLQTLSEIATEKNSTIIFPSQFMDTVKSLKSFMSEESPMRGPRPPMPPTA